MNRVNVLLIEDTKAEQEALSDMLSANGYAIAGVASTLTDALRLLHSCEVDVMIVDVFLDGAPDGIALAEMLHFTPGIARPFVFLTSSNDRGVFERAKLTRPFSFLLKPYNELEVLYAIEMAVEKFYGPPGALPGTQETVAGSDCLYIKKKQSLKKVLYDDILYIEVEERYCNIVTEREKFVIMISLTRIAELLDKDRFVRTHRNFLVNTGKIEEIVLQDNLVILKGGHRVVLAEKHQDFIRKFNILR
jgi:two-component system, LytTR family, response regulator